MQPPIRLFVAAPLPENVKQQLKQYITAFHAPEVRFVPDDNLHLTLFFIGNASPDLLPEIEAKLAAIAAEAKPFELELHNLEPGPKPKNPRLVWARFVMHPAFTELSQQVTAALAHNPEVPLKPIPHITLARFQKNVPTPVLPEVKPEEPVKLEVTELALWQSKLGQPHPVYTILRHFPFNTSVA